MSAMSDMVGPHRHPHLLRADGIINANRRVLNEDNCIELGYYVHKSKLGEGGFGKVMLATHMKTGHKVAIKMMNKAKLGSDLFRVRTEINSLKELRHENIAKLMQIIETDTDIYLVMEYCSGGELFDYLVAKSRLSENETRVIIRDLAKVLAFIHYKGFAHRDLKPENILFDTNHRIKLIDFGLAASGSNNNNSLDSLKTCCGSPAYAAPELLSGPNYSGPAVDVWSAGILLYALLVGKLPFDHDNISVLYKMIANGKFHMPSYLSLQVQDLISSMLKTNPNERITVEQILSHPWLNPLGQVDTRIQILEETLDDWAFFECHRLFPMTDIKDLRHNVLHAFNYQTAAYCLISMNNTSLNNINPMVLRSSPMRTNRRRSRSMGEATNNENAFPTVNQNLMDAKKKGLDSPRMVKAFASPGVKSKIPVPVSSPKPRDLIKLRQIQSPKDCPSPNKKARFPDDTDIGRRSSPLRAKQVLSPKTPVNLKTPNAKIDCVTQKKSLFKRFLETATPSRSQNPRTINISSNPQNITQTKFSDPQKCINKLVNSLTFKGIQCKQKDFTLRCVLSTNNTIMLSFNLEICKFGDKCVIQRKRLKGDSWQYKKVCEEILRISNE